MAEVKTPQDRKPKVTKYSFTDVDGKRHTLPLASESAVKIPGKMTRDVIMDPDDEQAQLRLGFAMLEASGVAQETLDALYAKPTPDMLEVMGEWMTHGDGKGATVPQS